MCVCLHVCVCVKGEKKSVCLHVCVSVGVGVLICYYNFVAYQEQKLGMVPVKHKKYVLITLAFEHITLLVTVMMACCHHTVVLSPVRV